MLIFFSNTILLFNPVFFFGNHDDIYFGIEKVNNEQCFQVDSQDSILYLIK